jgi:hypothetical protein
MNNSRLEKLAPLTGVVAVVLIIIGAALIGALVWLPSADRAVEIFSDNPIRVSAGGYAGLISAIFMIWFAGSVYSALREREGGTGRLSLVAFGGGVASGVVLAAGFSFVMVSGARAEAGGGISPAEAVALYDLYSSVFAGMFNITMVVFIGATAAVSLRKAVFPAWFGWVSVLIAFGLLILFIGYIVLAPALVWLLVVSIWLYRRGASAA